ncbi:MAG TPA: hypothetical protein GXZ58_10500 [Bacilli bacterium]|nr:hypothetical protein [Bacilli bacterium]
MEQIVILMIIAIPFVLSVWNIYVFIRYLIRKKEKNSYKVIEVMAMCLGIVYLYLYAELANISFVNWDVQLYNLEKHSMIMPDAFLTIATILLIAFMGYILIRFISADRQSPIVSVMGISAIYLGIGICILWCIQTIDDFFLVLFPVNCIIIFVKTVYIFVYQKNTILQNGIATTRFKQLSSILNKATNLPWVALILVIPLLGIIITILVLFGQEPNDVIKAWTETADWTLSKKIAPQNIQYDEHYLCTVAAGGHRKIVKPIRTGMRHGNRVLVNRQLCIANAFEQVLEEKIPVFHKIVRAIYDRTGYPISKHIHSKYLADTIYFLMKPLEWIFLLVLYTVDVHPENRIAVQYPHRSAPKIVN